MTALFWIIWIIDMLICAIALIAKGFADSFHPGSSVPWLLFLLLGCTAGGFILQVLFKKTDWALGLAALPLLVFGALYLVEKATGR